MSNAERQRRFRERNPGYYGRLHRKRNAAIKAILEQQKAEAAARIQAEIQARLQMEQEFKLAIIKQLPPISRMLPPAVPPDPLMQEIAALAEKRRAGAAIHVREA